MHYLLANPSSVLVLAWQHLRIVGTAVFLALLIGIPTGVAITRVRWLATPVLATAGVLYTIPSLALFAVLIPLTGLGERPAIVAVLVYSLLVIIRNTVAGIDAVEPSIREAAHGMGMTPWQRLRLVEIPLGLPVIVAGIRVATVAGIGIATIAAYVGAGGLGVLIFDGIRTLNLDTVVAGALSASALALAADWAFVQLESHARRDRCRGVS